MTDPQSQKIVAACVYCKSLYRVPRSFIGRPVTCPRCRRSFTAEETRVRSSSTQDEGLLLCKIALNYGFIGEEALKAVMTDYAVQALKSTPKTFESLLVSRGGVSAERLGLIKDIRRNWDLRLAEKRFADDAVAFGFISRSTAREALARQARLFGETRQVTLLSDMLVASGDLTADQCRKILDGPINGTARKPRPDTAPARTTPPMTATPSSSAPRPSARTEAVPAQDAEPPKAAERPQPAVQPETAAPLPPEPSPEPARPDPAPDRHTAAHAPEPVSPTAAPHTEPSIAPPGDDDETIPPAAETADTTPPAPEPPAAPPVSPPDAPPRAVSSDMPPGDTGRIIPIKGLELIIDDEGLTATLKVPDGVDPHAASIQDIRDVLIEEGIVYGIVEDSLIRGFLNSKIFREKPFTVAEGIAPRPGIQGKIRYHFDTDYLKIGSITESGNIDFKNRGEIPYVEEGTLLAEITPSVQGKSGRDIYGRDLLVEKVPEMILRCDTGTRQSDDKTRIYAAVSGQPKLNFGDRIQVLSELTIPGDVGFETGHVEFEGNVIIKGAVLEDFIVKGATVTAREVIGATIFAGGDLTVHDGISNSTLHVVGNIQAKFIHKSIIHAYGNVEADKEIIDCRIENSGACLVERGKIISSEISSKLGITAKEVGTEMSHPCKLRIGVDDHITREIGVIDEDIEAYGEKLADMEKTLAEFGEQEKESHRQITALAHVQDRAQLEQKTLRARLETLGATGTPENVDAVEARIAELDHKAREADEAINRHFDEQDKLVAARDACQERIDQCLSRIEELKQQKKDKIAWARSIRGTAYLKTTGPVFAGTAVSGPHCTKVFKETTRHVRLHEAASKDAPEGWEMKLS
ncbi:hypothetical protein JCM14469_39690 [Desulfatiferula olefinivorans]